MPGEKNIGGIEEHEPGLRKPFWTIRNLRRQKGLMMKKATKKTATTAKKKTATKKKAVKFTPTEYAHNAVEAVKKAVEQSIGEKSVCWMKTPCATKIIGVVLITLGWLGTYLECMGKYFAIPLLVIGIAQFVNGIKDEIVDEIGKK